MFVSPCGLVTFSLKSEEWNSRSCNTPPEQTYEGIWLTWEPAGSSKIAGFILKDPYFFLFLKTAKLVFLFHEWLCSAQSWVWDARGPVQPPLCWGRAHRLFLKVADGEIQAWWDVVAPSWECPWRTFRQLCAHGSSGSWEGFLRRAESQCWLWFW